MKRFMHLFVGSICFIGFVCAMMSAYKYASNLKILLFYVFVGLMNCMFAISKIKDYSFVLSSILFILLLLLFSSGTFGMIITIVISIIMLLYLLSHK